MDQNFSQALSWVRQDEGGNDDDPDDPGGRTSRGIIQREYDAYRKQKGLALQDVWRASDAEIDDIYRTEYWLPEGNWMPIAIDYMFFDFKVNAGPHRAIVLLQRAVGVNDDGRIGPVTRAAIAGANIKQLIDDYSESKRAFYRSLHRPKYIKGWLNRVNAVESRANSMIKTKT